jgi:hypothetical protein
VTAVCSVANVRFLPVHSKELFEKLLQAGVRGPQARQKR